MEQYIQELYNITKKQEECLDHEEVESFIGLLEERQNVIDTILEMKKEQEFSKEQLQVVKEIKALDEANQEKYMQLFEDTKLKLRQIRAMQANEKKYMSDYIEYSQAGIFGARK